MSVDGHVVCEFGTRVDSIVSVIHVDGIRVQTDSSLLTLALYKPPGVASTMCDDMGGPGLTRHVEDRPKRLYYVGRFDQNTEGFILLSNDGELAYCPTHPKCKMLKTYITRIESPVTRGLGRVFERGITLEDGPARVNRFILRKSAPRNSIIEITLHSGRNRIVCRMMAEVGRPVMELVRVKLGTVVVGHLKLGKTRVVTRSELGAFTRPADL